MASDECYSLDFVLTLLATLDLETQFETFKKIQMYALVTVLVLVLQLGYLMKPFAYRYFRLLSWISYLLVPVLISYILGLMGRIGHIKLSQYRVFFPSDGHALVTFRYLTCVWATFLLFAYAGFDNLNAFSLEERYGRPKLLVQIGIQFTLLFLIIYNIPPNANVAALCLAFIILAFKFVGRLLSLAHSAGATPRIKNEVTRIIDYMNNKEDVDVDPVSTAGFDYLVGPNYTIIEGERVVDGITMKKIWGSDGILMGSSLEHDMELKDTCLSFALFWLLLGKFCNYHLYDDNTKSSPSFRAKAWRLVRHGLLAKKGDHERVFRVIEIELAFLHDYFHARYLFFYLNGFYWKVISIVALPFMFWWFIRKVVDYSELERSFSSSGTRNFIVRANTTIITVVVALEVIQVVVFLFSRWLKVTLLCFYVNHGSNGCLSRFLRVIVSMFLSSSRASNCAWWMKPWKRELDQYSLVQSRTALSKPTTNLLLQFISIAGLPFSKPNWKHGRKVALSGEVKEAIVLCLQQNDVCLKLSNGAHSLRRNGVMQNLPVWSCNLKNDAETILVWHIATCVSELHHDTPQSSTNKRVAIELSRYCAYLLFFAPSLLPVRALVAEKICDAVIKETLNLFNKPFFGCGKVAENTVKYEMLMNLINVEDEEAADDKGLGNGVLRNGAKLGSALVTQVEDEETRWKILAEFWAEMILYLAPSNNNELAHAGKLSHEGEFITQLWALLIHAGIYDREDMVTTTQPPNEF